MIGQRLSYRERWIEVGPLRHVAGPRKDARQGLRHPCSQHPDLTGAGLQHAHEELDGRRLSRPVGSEESVDRSLRHRQVETGELEIAGPIRQPGGEDCISHRRLLEASRPRHLRVCRRDRSSLPACAGSWRPDAGEVPANSAASASWSSAPEMPRFMPSSISSRASCCACSARSPSRRSLEMALTYVPIPRRLETNPSRSSCRYACATVAGFTRRSVAS